MSGAERLAQSRERLRQAMRPPDAPGGSAEHPSHTSRSPDWLLKLRAAPAARLLVSVFENWWARQPMRVALTLAAETGAVMLQPTAQKYPFKLVLGAAAAGSLLMWVRPWRWISTTALLAGLIPPLVAEVLKRRNGSS